MRPLLFGYLRLCRPPNLPTAAADVLAGLAIAGFFATGEPSFSLALLLLLSSVFLYAGGVVLNDVFDYELDKEERPERPLPSGLISFKNAFILGFSLLFLGVLLGGFVNVSSLVLAFLLAMAILGYDIYAKKHKFLGPLNMGVCRALNLLLGISVFQDFTLAVYAVIPLVFIFAVTLISRGEVHGNNRNNILLAGLMYALVIALVIGITQLLYSSFSVYLFFLFGFAIMVYVPLIKAYRHNQPKQVMKAVKAGVLSIILLDAAMATAHTNWQTGLSIVILLPISLGLARLFSVT